MKKIPLSTLKVFGMQSLLLNEFSRSVIFSRKMTGLDSVPDRFIVNTLTKQAVVVWCQVFGARSEDCHWSQVVSKQDVVEPFSRNKILEVVDMSLDDWSAYHDQIKCLRDKFFVHFDMDSLETTIPSMGIALKISEAYRDWMYDMFSEYRKVHLLNIGFYKTVEFNELIEDEWASKVKSIKFLESDT